MQKLWAQGASCECVKSGVVSWIACVFPKTMSCKSFAGSPTDRMLNAIIVVKTRREKNIACSPESIHIESKIDSWSRENHIHP